MLLKKFSWSSEQNRETELMKSSYLVKFEFTLLALFEIYNRKLKIDQG